jgi:hypothetical protein
MVLGHRSCASVAVAKESYTSSNTGRIDAMPERIEDRCAIIEGSVIVDQRVA